VYVFAIDSHGERRLLFPPSGQGNVETRLPYPSANASDQSGFPSAIPLALEKSFTVGPPFGVECATLAPRERLE